MNKRQIHVTLLIQLLFTVVLFAQQGINNLEDLSLVRSDYISMMHSSHDLKGGNDDFKSFRYQDGDEYVFADISGPGVIDRIWFTGIDANDELYFYFDGEETPRLKTTMSSFFENKRSGFYPLVTGPAESSGGYTSYMPMPFEKSVRITTKARLIHGHAVYFHNISYKKFESAEGIVSWTSEDDIENEKTIWGATGTDPKEDVDELSEEKTINVAPGTSAVLYNKADGVKMISKFLLEIDALKLIDDINIESVTSGGRAFIGANGKSEFTLTIDPNNTGVKLVRLFDEVIPNQKSNVYIDGTFIGEWFTADIQSYYRGQKTEFNIPESFTSGKSSINVKIEFVSASGDWNEFYYWAYSIVNNEEILSDELDIRNATSETAHSYSITGQSWEGEQTLFFEPEGELYQNNKELLSNVWIKMTWDNENIPSVEAPLGMFFGFGNIAPVKYKSLMTGVINEKTLYSYWPMPYKSSAKIELINNSTIDLSNVNSKVYTSAVAGELNDIAKFKTKHNSLATTVTGKEYLLLETEGTGHYVGTVMCVNTFITSGYLEGDERFYIDDSKTPYIYGTGSEDYFNGAWYFLNGKFGLAAHGAPVIAGDNRTMYRYHLSDPISFLSKGVFGIEHGPVNDFNADYESLAIYYLLEDENSNAVISIELSDEFSVTDASQAFAHNYTVTDKISEYNVTSSYEGVDDKIVVNGNTISHNGESSFTVSINPNNNGVRLLRTFDFSTLNQKANIYVDGSLVGEWYSAGQNTDLKWRDEHFMIAPVFTKGKNEINISVKVESENSQWNESVYKIYSITNSFENNIEDDNAMSIANVDTNMISKIYPNPIKDNTVLRINSDRKVEAEVKIYNTLGQQVLRVEKQMLNEGVNELRLNFSGLSSGTYIYKIIKTDNVLHGKFIKE